MSEPTLADALDAIRCEARDCGCSERIERRLLGVAYPGGKEPVPSHHAREMPAVTPEQIREYEAGVDGYERGRRREQRAAFNTAAEWHHGYVKGRADERAAVVCDLDTAEYEGNFRDHVVTTRDNVKDHNDAFDLDDGFAVDVAIFFRDRIERGAHIHAHAGPFVTGPAAEPGDQERADSYNWGFESGSRHATAKVVAWLRVAMRGWSNAGKYAEDIERGAHLPSQGSDAAAARAALAEPGSTPWEQFKSARGLAEPAPSAAPANPSKSSNSCQHPHTVTCGGCGGRVCLRCQPQGCPACAAPDVDAARAALAALNCAHGRSGGAYCPHCLGIATYPSPMANSPAPSAIPEKPQPCPHCGGLALDTPEAVAAGMCVMCRERHAYAKLLVMRGAAPGETKP
jgi:hypothetical protein